MPGSSDGTHVAEGQEWIWPRLIREANSSSVPQQVNQMRGRDCLREPRKGSYFEVGSGLPP